MTNIHSNNSRKILESNGHNKTQVVELPDLAKQFTNLTAELPQPELEPVVTADQAPVSAAELPIAEVAPIAMPPPTAPKLPFIRQKVMIGLGVIVASLVGGTIAWNRFPAEQSQRIAEAEALFTEACHTTTLPDATALNQAETAWNSANARLQGISMFGFGTQETKLLREKYAWCKTNIDATKLFQEAATISEAARIAVKQSSVLPEETWANHVTRLQAAIEHLRDVQIRFGNQAEIAKSLPIVHDVQSRLADYEQIHAVAQERYDAERNAVQNFKAANRLYQQFTANQNATDANQRTIAEAHLQNAIEHLQKIPPEGTTVSIEAAKVYQTYKQALYRSRLEPARQELRQIVESLKQLENNLGSDVSPEAFGASLDRIRNQLNQQQLAPTTHLYTAFEHLKSALADWQFAASLRSVCNDQSNCFTGWLDGDVYLRHNSAFYRSLVDNYNAEPVWTVQGAGLAIKQTTAINTVVESARYNVNAASQLIEQ
jgi:hypothetical protein